MTPERIEQERKAFEAWMVELYPTNPQTQPFLTQRKTHEYT